jgi:hypothetical protein
MCDCYPKQRDGGSCDVFAISFAEFLIFSKKKMLLPVPRANTNTKRRKAVALLWAVQRF